MVLVWLYGPLVIAAILLWCFGRYVLHCRRKWICIFVSIGIAAVTYGLFWVAFFSLDALPIASLTLDIIGGAVVCLLVSWLGLRYCYADNEVKQSSGLKSFVLALIFTVVQTGMAIGAGILVTIDIFSDMKFTL
ncbi:MAG: hypothetical protein VX527_09955 [Planctomycetota bacterium]|nr:hypothetical protein [Planctomycetota bacterium]